MASSNSAKHMPLPEPLPVSKVYAPCSHQEFRFSSTKNLAITHEIIAQNRAVEAINVGLGIRKPGYNIYVAGYYGTGKTSVIKTFLESWSYSSQTPQDWIYVFDFQNHQSPRAISLPAGSGFKLQKLMDEAVKDLRKEIPRALQSEDYENAVNAYLSQNNEKQSRRFSELEKMAKKMDFILKSSRMGIETIPVVEGRILTEKEYSKLTERERHKIEGRRGLLEPKVLEFARKVRALEIDSKDYVKNLQRAIGVQVVGAILDPIDAVFKDLSEVAKFLTQIREDILENLLDFVDFEENHDDENSPHTMLGEPKDKFVKYRVNLFVDNRNQKGAPVIIESNPTYYNLFGKVEKNAEHGMFLTDFTMIQAGSIHKANGGYLVLDANDVFKMPTVWDTLKRVLRNRKGFIEDMGEQFSMFPTSTLRPEPISLDIKVIMIGTDDIYHMLYEMDEEFSKIFKIKADFDFKMPRNKKNLDHYVSFIGTRAHLEDLLPFDRTGVASIIEFGSRLVEDQTLLSTQFGEIKDLTIEADYIARQMKDRVVKREHVEKALEKKFYRINLAEHQLMEMVKNQSILLSLDGKAVGQVNGLSVYDMGDYSFGKVARLTCTVSTQDSGILNIDRMCKLTGQIHDKGAQILAGFINTLLSRKKKLSLSASICFEQSYGVIDGDSATIAELIALLSAMSLIPVRQNLAITGSLNQMGEVQPVGGINEKIEGFYKTAKTIGKGRIFDVIIPAQNVTNLMLNKETRTAVAKKNLRIFPVNSFWQAFELATKVPFGAKTIYDEKFEKGSALTIIQERLRILDEEQKQRKEEEKT